MTGFQQLGTQCRNDRVIALRIGVFACAINGGAGHEGIDAGAGDFGDIGDIHPTVDFQTDAAAACLFIGIKFFRAE